MWVDVEQKARAAMEICFGADQLALVVIEMCEAADQLAKARTAYGLMANG
ncbi:MAG: hypothetical protein ACTS2F_28395 [Thainema sp.]